MYDKFMILLGMVVPFFNLPHILKMVELQSSAGQSAVAVLAFNISFLFLLVYGIKKKDKVIMVTYTMAFFVGCVYLSTILYYL